jgi:hypothetical protein
MDGELTMGKRPQNGPTFTKAPPRKRRQSLAAPSPERKIAELAEKTREAAKSRRFHQRFNNDFIGLFREAKLFSAHWYASEALSPSHHQPKMPTEQQQAFEDLQSTVKFVMEDLEESRRSGAWIMMGSTRVDFPTIKRMYAAEK